MGNWIMAEEWKCSGSTRICCCCCCCSMCIYTCIWCILCIRICICMSGEKIGRFPTQSNSKSRCYTTQTCKNKSFIVFTVVTASKIYDSKKLVWMLQTWPPVVGQACYMSAACRCLSPSKTLAMLLGDPGSSLKQSLGTPTTPHFTINALWFTVKTGLVTAGSELKGLTLMRCSSLDSLVWAFPQGHSK